MLLHTERNPGACFPFLFFFLKEFFAEGADWERPFPYKIPLSSVPFKEEFSKSK